MALKPISIPELRRRNEASQAAARRRASQPKAPQEKPKNN